MKLSDTFLYIFGSLSSIGFLAGGIGYLTSQFKSGTKKANSEIMSSSTEIINFYKTENENLKIIAQEKDRTNDEKFQKLTAEIGEVRGLYMAEKAQNERLEKIFQNRDPDTLKFQQIMIESVNSQTIINEKIVHVLSDIYTMTKTEHERDFKLTTTTAITKTP